MITFLVPVDLHALILLNLSSSCKHVLEKYWKGSSKYFPYDIEPRSMPDLEDDLSDSEEHEDSPLVACSTTSRWLSILARPRIFETVKIYDKFCGERLLALIDTRPEISHWVQEVHIRARRSRVGPTRNNLP